MTLYFFQNERRIYNYLKFLTEKVKSGFIYQAARNNNIEK